MKNATQRNVQMKRKTSVIDTAPQLHILPEDLFSHAAEIGHEIDSYQRYAEDALKLKPFDQLDWIDVSVGDVHTYC